MSKNFHRSVSANAYDEGSIKTVENSFFKLCPNWVETRPWEFDLSQREVDLESAFSREEFNTVLANTKDNSSPGTDRMDYYILKRLPTKLKDTLLNLINEIIFNGKFPSDWKEFRIFFIPKTGKGKFRPISIAQCTLKLAERLINNRLLSWLEERKILPESQYGFRHNRSYQDSVAILHSQLYREKSRGRTTAGVLGRRRGVRQRTMRQVNGEIKQSGNS